MPYIYILHFHEKIAHAAHYTGSTTGLKARLTAHANGAGARLTRELHDRGIDWTLGGLMTVNQTNLRKLERKLKNIAHADRYCELCTRVPSHLPGTTPYSIHAVPFAANSWSLKTDSKLPKDLIMRLTNENDNAALMEQIKYLMRSDKDALGFIPAGGQQGLNTLVANGRIAIVQTGQELLGYAAYTVNPAREITTIHQCVVKDSARLLGLGKSLVAMVRREWPETNILAKVREDLAANHFWQAIGFAHLLSKPHETSGNLINHYGLKQRKE